jgi:hypothetical protein
MPVAGAAGITTFVEASAVRLDMEMHKVTESRNTYIVRLEMDYDLYKISVSSTSELRNSLFESEVCI